MTTLKIFGASPGEIARSCSADAMQIYMQLLHEAAVRRHKHTPWQLLDMPQPDLQLQRICSTECTAEPLESNSSGPCQDPGILAGCTVCLERGCCICTASRSLTLRCRSGARLTKVHIAAVPGLELLACHRDVACNAAIKDCWSIDGACMWRNSGEPKPTLDYTGKMCD